MLVQTEIHKKKDEPKKRKMVPFPLTRRKGASNQRKGGANLGWEKWDNQRKGKKGVRGFQLLRDAPSKVFGRARASAARGGKPVLELERG